LRAIPPSVPPGATLCPRFIFEVKLAEVMEAFFSACADGEAFNALRGLRSRDNASRRVTLLLSHKVLKKSDGYGPPLTWERTLNLVARSLARHGGAHCTGHGCKVPSNQSPIVVSLWLALRALEDRLGVASGGRGKRTCFWPVLRYRDRGTAFNTPIVLTSTPSERRALKPQNRVRGDGRRRAEIVSRFLS